MSSQDNYSFIVYESNQAPKYYSLPKNQIKFVYYILPSIAGLSLMGLVMVFIYFDQIRLTVEKKEPLIIGQLREEKSRLEKELTESKALGTELQQKLLSSTSTSSSGPLSLFKITPGFQDFTATPVFSIEEIEAFADSRNVHLRFNIINLDQNNEKKAGYIWALMKGKDFVTFYPSSGQSDSLQFNYSEGEPFATTRFRPVDALFTLPVKGQESYLFKILIFSRTGDLLHKQSIVKTLSI